MYLKRNLEACQFFESAGKYKYIILSNDIYFNIYIKRYFGINRKS